MLPTYWARTPTAHQAAAPCDCSGCKPGSKRAHLGGFLGTWPPSCILTHIQASSPQHMQNNGISDHGLQRSTEWASDKSCDSKTDCPEVCAFKGGVLNCHCSIGLFFCTCWTSKPYAGKSYSVRTGKANQRLFIGNSRQRWCSVSGPQATLLRWLAWGEGDQLEFIA